VLPNGHSPIGNSYEVTLLPRFGLDGGQPKTFDQIGELIGVTRYKVPLCEMATMCRLRTGVSNGSYLRDLRGRGVAAVSAAAMPANYNQTNKTVFNNRAMSAHVSLKQKK